MMYMIAARDAHDGGTPVFYTRSGWYKRTADLFTPKEAKTKMARLAEFSARFTDQTMVGVETDARLDEPRPLGVDTYEQLGDLSSMRGKRSEFRKALIDSALYGTGFMQDGKHVPASEVRVAGSKRLPQVGEIWLARDGATRIAVLKRATLLGGGFDCVTLTKGATALKEGYPIVVNLDGRYIRGVPQESHPLDLVTFHSSFLA